MTTVEFITYPLCITCMEIIWLIGGIVIGFLTGVLTVKMGLE